MINILHALYYRLASSFHLPVKNAIRPSRRDNRQDLKEAVGTFRNAGQEGTTDWETVKKDLLESEQNGRENDV